MNISMQAIADIAKIFAIPGELTALDQIGNGNINQTYDVTMTEQGIPARYVFQRLNTFVFKQPVQIMENISRITAHCEKKLLAMGESRDRVMHFLARENGENYYIDGDAFWRVCEFVPE